MPAPEQLPRLFRRIVVRFANASGVHPGVLAAARFARLFEADLAGIFVEDSQLLDPSSLTVMRQLRVPAGSAAEPTADQLARDFAAAAALARHQIVSIGRQLGLSTTFDVVRGNVAALSSDGWSEGDLLVIFEPVDPFARAVEPFQSILREIVRSASPILYAPRQLAKRSGGPVVAIGLQDDQATRLAATIAAATGEHSILLTDSALTEGLAGSRRPLARTISSPQVAKRLTPDAIDHALAGVKESLIVMSRAAHTTTEPDFQDIASRRRVPMLIVGEAAKLS